MRAGPHCGHTIITLDTAIGLSRSAMPPLICLDGLGRVCRLTIITCSTSSLPVLSSTLRTRPVLPLSRPEMTLTLSFFLISMRTGATGFLRVSAIIVLLALLPASRTLPGPPSDDLGCQGNDLHELLIAQFARHRPEYARPHRLAGFVDEDRGI